MDTPQKPYSALSLAELVGKLDELTKELEKLKSGFMNQNKLDAFFYEAPVPLLCIDRELKIHFANRVLLKLIGLSKDEIFNKEIAELIYVDNNLDELKTNLQKLFDKKISLYEDIIDFKTANKSKIHLKIKARLVKYDDEIKEAVHITLQDVSQEYKFKEAYKNIVENSLQAILIIQDFRIVFANQKAAEISGYSINELYSLDINGVKQLIHPDDRERLFNLMKESFGGKRVYPKHEFKGVRKNKEIYWLEVLVSPINYDKKPALQVVQLDVSDKKRAQDEIHTVEHKFKMLVEHSITGVYIIKSGVFTYVNPRFASIFGYSQDELINKASPQKIVYHEDWPKVKENLRKRIEGEVDSLHYEFRGIKKNNQIIFVEVHGSRTILDGEPAVIGMLQDVTERKENEAKLHLQSSALSSAANGIVITMN
jgi:PAS domain S-box-containing protein